VTVQVRPAATVVVMRDGDHGPEILMLKRSGRAGFFPDAWVFPGGRVDPADETSQQTGAVPRLAASDARFAVAAIRECFEEAGVWLGAGDPKPAFRDRLNDRSATLADAPDLVADLARLALWSRWVTPAVEPKRYDTYFFVAHLTREESAHAVHDDVETVQSLWITASDALGRATGPAFFLAPPTFRTLEELSVYATAKDIMAAAAHRVVRPIMPQIDMEGASLTIVLPGDPSYPSETPVDGPTRIAYRDGAWHSQP
jgi:8-oxo-dGTP pyrophosphatase MutT (NUDIX family)